MQNGGEYCISTLTSAFYFVHNDIPSFVYYEVVYPFLKLIRVSITTQQYCSHMTPLPYLLTLFIVLNIRFEIVPLGE